MNIYIAPTLELQAQGFKFGKSGAHAARSMMLKELTLLFDQLPAKASRTEYEQQIVQYNVLRKSSENGRKLSFRHMVALYGLSTDIPLFNVFRALWPISEAAQPLLALQFALVRDALLRSSTEVIFPLQPNELLHRDGMQTHLAKDDPDRFSAASLQSFARNLNVTWTQAGYLSGRINKTRRMPTVTFVNVVFALVLGHYQGLSGQRLFDSCWTKLLSVDNDTLHELAYHATLRGLIKFKKASEVVEVSFTPMNLSIKE